MPKLPRTLMALAALSVLAAPLLAVPGAALADPPPPKPVAGPVAGPTLYGYLASLKAKPGQRDALITVLAGHTRDMPGCLSYVVYKDVTDPDIVWVSEVWRSKAAHDASLDLPQVRDAMARGAPLIASVVTHTETVPVAGLEAK